ncbi:MAG: hypothetical protein OXG60_06225 [Chloroflexi bacterium]|nr:hypothetical protein [Chloroflexota bacterium]
MARGYEYEPLRTWVDSEPGQQELKLELKRWIDMKSRGYFSGDTHVHFLSAQGSMIEVYVIFQRQFIKGIAAGALSGI